MSPYEPAKMSRESVPMSGESKNMSRESVQMSRFKPIKNTCESTKMKSNRKKIMKS